MSYEKEIVLYFLVAGHTKNVCDGAFGHVTIKLLTSDVITPAQMMELVRDSSISTTCKPGTSVFWRNWKDLLVRYFQVPSRFRISNFHVFRASAENKGVLFVKRLSSSAQEQSFDFKKTESVNLSSEDLSNACFKSSWPSLDQVRPQKHETREGYLRHKILDPYYVNNDEVRSEFFGSGEGGSEV